MWNLFAYHSPSLYIGFPYHFFDCFRLFVFFFGGEFLFLTFEANWECFDSWFKRPVFLFVFSVIKLHFLSIKSNLKQRLLAKRKWYLWSHLRPLIFILTKRIASTLGFRWWMRNLIRLRQLCPLNDFTN